MSISLKDVVLLMALVVVAGIVSGCIHADVGNAR